MKSTLLFISLLFSFAFSYLTYPGDCVAPNPWANSNNAHASPNNDAGATVTINAPNGYSGNSQTPLTVSVTTSNNIGGFVLFAADVNGNHVGSFNPGTGQQTLGTVLNKAACPGATTLGHNMQLNINTMTASWIPPAAGTGAVTFNLFYAQNSNQMPYPSFMAKSALIQEGTPATGVTTSVSQAATTHSSATSFQIVTALFVFLLFLAL